jgi:hypothetical protein
MAAKASSSDDPFASVSSFFDSSTWSVVSLALKGFLVVMWLAIAFWTFRDARRRIREPAFIALAVALALVLPFLGAIVYLIVRPPEFLEDAHERELEVLALEQRVDGSRCPDCDFPIESGFLACPSCLRKLREPCVRCAAPLDPRWKICPFCETVVSAGYSSPLPPDPLPSDPDRLRS